MKAAILAGALALALAGCAATNAFGPQTGTLAGHVLLRVCGGPMPLEGQASAACLPRPFPSAMLSIEPQSGGQTVKVTTDLAGAYTVALPPGTYTVRVTQVAAQAGSGGTRGIADRAIGPATVQPRTVTVVAGQTVKLDFTITIELM